MPIPLRPPLVATAEGFEPSTDFGPVHGFTGHVRLPFPLRRHMGFTLWLEPRPTDDIWQKGFGSTASAGHVR
jgi:hypothetical protein